jgi:hypothetical protein
MTLELVVLEMLIFKGKKGMALKYQFYIAIYTKNILVNKKMIRSRIKLIRIKLMGQKSILP